MYEHVIQALRLSLQMIYPPNADGSIKAMEDYTACRIFQSLPRRDPVKLHQDTKQFCVDIILPYRHQLLRGHPARHLFGFCSNELHHLRYRSNLHCCVDIILPYSTSALERFTHTDFLNFLFLTVEHYNRYWYNHITKASVWSKFESNLPVRLN